jgi:hypothetical protein
MRRLVQTFITEEILTSRSLGSYAMSL